MSWSARRKGAPSEKLADDRSIGRTIFAIALRDAPTDERILDELEGTRASD